LLFDLAVEDTDDEKFGFGNREHAIVMIWNGMSVEGEEAEDSNMYAIKSEQNLSACQFLLMPKI
jgi:hypothetical protein